MPIAEQNSLAQFTKTFTEGSEEVQIQLFEIFLSGQKERKRQREKAKKQYEKRKAKKKPQHKVDAV